MSVSWCFFCLGVSFVSTVFSLGGGGGGSPKPKKGGCPTNNNPPSHWSEWDEREKKQHCRYRHHTFQNSHSRIYTPQTTHTQNTHTSMEREYITRANDRDIHTTHTHTQSMHIQEFSLSLSLCVFNVCVCVCVFFSPRPVMVVVCFFFNRREREGVESYHIYMYKNTHTFRIKKKRVCRPSSFSFYLLLLGRAGSLWNHSKQRKTEKK